MESVVIMNELHSFYKGKRVLVTGHTGFKGSWLALWLHKMGAHVIGYSLDPYTEKDNFVLSNLQDSIIDIRADIRDVEKLQHCFDTYKPEIVFHLAAQPLVRYSYDIPTETWDVNVMGTIHVLNAIRNCSDTKIGVMITSDKCYENREQREGYKEEDAMGGYDPYSSSKGAAEIAISSWRRSFMNPKQYTQHGKAIASARAGNVIGGGDWAKDRIIPDCIRALEAGNPIEVRNPVAVRPWQHVLEPLGGYLLLGYKLGQDPIQYAEGWNFGPVDASVVPVWDVAEMVTQNYGSGERKDVSKPGEHHEATLLALDITKAQKELGWEPRLSVEESIQLTVDWYKRYTSTDVFALCNEQIEFFESKAPKC